MNTKEKINISYLNLAAQSPSLELNFSISEKMYNETKHKHIVYMCDKALNSCSVNVLNKKSICNICTYKAEKGFKIFNKRNPNSELRRISKKDFLKLNKPKVSNKIFDDLLFGVHSTISSQLRLDNMDLLDKHWSKIKDEMIISSLNLFHFFNKELSSKNVKNFILFNGRLNCARPLTISSKLNNVDFTLFDGNINGKVPIISKNQMFHSLNFQKKTALKVYVENFKESRALAKSYIERKINKVEVDDHAYIKNQITGHIDKEILAYNKPIITIYVSSDDEYRFLGNDWNDYGIVDQIECIKEINNSVLSDKFSIIVKMHPNQKYLHKSIQDKYINLSKNMHILFPENKTDTYSLLMKSEIIINFCSTVGVEANYLRKPVVQIGPSRFCGLPAANYVKTASEAIEIIKSNKYKIMPIRASIVYFTFYMKDTHLLKAYNYIEDGVFKYGNEFIRAPFILRISAVLDKFYYHILKGNKELYTNALLYIKNLILAQTKVK
jgi:hypothetical protein